MIKVLKCASCLVAANQTISSYTINKIYTPSLLGINLAKTQYNSRDRWIYDKPAVIKQVDKWAEHIPWIKPYYAVKSNPLPYLLDDIVNHKVASSPDFRVGLDVASAGETELALRYTDLSNTIFTNPHTVLCEYSDDTQYQLKVVDSLCEIKILHSQQQKAPILVRINSGIQSANINFDTKFGASNDEVYEIIYYAKRHGLLIRGISFHIGSGGDFSRKIAYQKAYHNALPFLDIIQKNWPNKLPMEPILNFGGGLLHDTDLGDALGWTKHLPFQMMAEPGRYFSEPSHHLVVQVIAVTPRGVFLDNGVYHELNAFHRDHWTMPKLEYVFDGTRGSTVAEYRKVKVFGPTCDSYDTIGEQELPININVGDKFLLPNMGAYTSAGTVNFNGILGAAYTP